MLNTNTGTSLLFQMVIGKHLLNKSFFVFCFCFLFFVFYHNGM